MPPKESESVRPGVAVVIITYHGDAYVEKAIRSVLDQTFTNLELCVVEDGSRDKTESIVDGFADARARYLWRPNGGLSAARNTGIAATSAPLIAFLDCDDWWHPEKIASQVRALEADPEIGLVYSEGVAVNENTGETLQILSDAEGDILEKLLVRQCVAGSASSVIVRRSVIAEAGAFDESIKYAEDWECWLRLAAVTKVARVSEPHIFLKRSQSFGQQTDAIRKSVRAFLEAAFLRHAPRFNNLRRRAFSQVEFVASIDFLDRGDRGNSYRSLFRAIAECPWAAQNYRRFALMLLGKI